MNFVGKAFVLIYGAGSIFCLIIATAIYTQRMDFVLAKGETSKESITRVDRAIKETKDLIVANNRAYTRWMLEYEEVLKLEVDQFQRREFYRGQLELVKTGKLEGIVTDDPVQELPDRDPTTDLMAINQPTGRMKPILVKLEGMLVSAKPRPFYVGTVERPDDGSIPKANDTIGKLLAADKDLTAALVAATNAIIDQPTVKGLHTRIKEQLHIAEIADDERIYLEDFITNRRADAQLYVKRRNALAASIDRLEKMNNRKPARQEN